MWLKKGTPVWISEAPLPSRSNSTPMSVSRVLRLISALLAIASLLPKARLDGARVVVQTFQPRHADDSGSQRREPLFAGVDTARALDEIIASQRREKPRAAARWQNVIRPGHVVTQGRSRIRADENRARVADRRNQAFGFPHHQRDVFRRDLIGNVHGFFQPARDNDRPVFFERL